MRCVDCFYAARSSFAEAFRKVETVSIWELLQVAVIFAVRHWAEELAHQNEA
jgi:hypothetical protein